MSEQDEDYRRGQSRYGRPVEREEALARIDALRRRLRGEPEELAGISVIHAELFDGYAEGAYPTEGTTE